MFLDDSFVPVRRHAALEEIQSLGLFPSIRWIEQTDSTNRQLSEEIRSGSVRTPALLVADRQSGGKGRGGNQWFSPPGCLMFTLAVPFAASSRDSGVSNLLPLEVGVSVAQALAPLSQYRPQVKWPNDVYILDKKVCGVLIEVVQSPFKASLDHLEEQIDAPHGFQPGEMVAIIGVGINCQVDFGQATAEVQQRATSLHLMTSKTTAECSPEDVLVQFLQAWKSLRVDAEERPQWLLECWKDWSFLEGKWITLEKATAIGASTASQSLQGLCLGIDSTGALLLATPPGQAVSVIAGTVVKFRDA